MNDQCVGLPNNELNFCDSTLQRLDRLTQQTRDEVNTIEHFLDRFGIEFRNKSDEECVKENNGEKPSVKDQINYIFSQLESLNDRLDNALNSLNKIA